MKIGIDFDDCLIDYFPTLIEYLNGVFNTTFTKEDMFSFDLEEIWKVERKVMLEKISEFYSVENRTNFYPVKDALFSIHKLKEKHKLIVVTGRPDTTNSFVKNWLDKYFPETFEKIIHTNQFFGVKKEKALICKEEGLEAFVDDYKETILDISKNGIKSFLMDEPWNQGEIPENVKRVKGWEDILAELV